MFGWLKVPEQEPPEWWDYEDNEFVEWFEASPSLPTMHLNNCVRALVRLIRILFRWHRIRSNQLRNLEARVLELENG